jgi:hypothetical protein
MPINSFLYPGAKVVQPYEVANSLRFDDGSSDYLNRSSSSTGNRKTFTISFWGKRGNLTLGGTSTALSSGDFSNGNNHTYIGFDASDDDMRIQSTVGGSNKMSLLSSAKFRDVSAWYHFVWKVDTTQSTQEDRVKFYVNGVENSISGTYPLQNEDTFFGDNDTYRIGVRFTAQSTYWDGYLAEVCYVDGTALDPTSFGEFDEDTGIWKPIDVSGLTFGTNGFYLDFEDSSALGNDVSGNDNDFTVNNLTSIDQTTDTCTNNFATLNPLDVYASKTGTLSEGNTKLTVTTSNLHTAVGTIAPSSGKWYWEVELDSTDGSNPSNTGISNLDEDDKSNMPSKKTWGYGYNASTGDKQNNATNTSYGSSYTSGDIIGVAMDLDNGAVWFSKNGTWQNSATQSEIEAGTTTNSAFTFTVGGSYAPYVADNTSGVAFTWLVNFGNPAFSISSGNSDGNGYGNFEYSVPSGYYALNSKNLSEYG